jgi:peptide/nickel transport system ATP-binding protein/oligopeptide transport system ATP-binding protein
VSTPLLEVRDYRLAFDTFDGTLHVLDGIDLAVAPGETLGIVGETGCGKSVLARSILRLNPQPPARVVSGEIASQPGRPGCRRRGAPAARSAIAMVFQDPATYLNPLLTVATQMETRSAARTRPTGSRYAAGRPRARPRPTCWPPSACRSRGGCAPPNRTSCRAACASAC